eukprot:14407268-Ditylum_brightwellii.AAC.1
MGVSIGSLTLVIVHDNMSDEKIGVLLVQVIGVRIISFKFCKTDLSVIAKKCLLIRGSKGSRTDLCCWHGGA